MTTISVSHRYETERVRADQRAGVTLTSQRQAERRGLRDDSLDRPQTPLQLPAIYSPTHYAPSGVVPGPHLGDPKGQEGPGAAVAVAQAGPLAADCGTAPPCGGGLYGGPARGLTFGRWRTLGVCMEYVCMKPKIAAPTFFTERTLAAYLAVSDRTIRNWIRRGELPSYKLGSSRRIDPADVDAFLAQRREAS
jgi:excisionase family DNA binding protein